MSHSPPAASRSVPEAQVALRDLAERWRGSSLGETQAFHSWFREFCDCLGVAPPGPDGAGNYSFEFPRKYLRPDGTESPGRIDCWKAGHFAVEAKASGTGLNDALLRRAFNQLHGYVHAEHGTIPPYLMVVDVPHELIIWDGWSGRFGGFARGDRIRLETLHQRPELVALLQDIFTNPAARDPRGKAQQVTKEIAAKLAELAARLEGDRHPERSRGIPQPRTFTPEQVARFLMRCVFCFFAEDVGLLPKKLFQRTLETAQASGDAGHVAEVLTNLWQRMDQGGMFGADRIDRFNGHFFQSVESLPLEPADVTLLIEAAGFDWSAVEPSIFGTLLVRALDPVERHRLGAEYTPREYIERLVEPTVLEPLRARWAAVEARVKQLEADEAPADDARARRQSRKTQKLSKPRREALAEVQSFHAWLRGLRFLDPACGSGNFLYVTMAAVKELELEVIREIERLGAREGTEQTEQILDEVHPRQFFGLEVSWWAREIAELTLWIGYHQFWRRVHGGRTPPIPILEDTGTIECRDAILAWDEIVHRPEKDRPDPTPRIRHPVTGELVPDPEAKLKYMEYVGARPAEWPEADFIVGNPPYMGSAQQRASLGDGYTDALRTAYGDLADTIDLVGYWVDKAARAIATSSTSRVGLITTKAIGQTRSRVVLESAAALGVRPMWVIRNHPWIDEADSAAVRVAMIVLALNPTQGRLLEVDSRGVIRETRIGPTLHPNLTLGHDVTETGDQPLLANSGLCSNGMDPTGTGFILSDSEARTMIRADPALSQVVREYRNGRDIANRPRGAWIIDFGLLEEAEARLFSVPFDIVRTKVKPQRMSSAQKGYRDFWWRFARPRPDLREALSGLGTFIVTVKTARHRYFLSLSSHVVPDSKLICFAVDDPAILATLSSTVHISWSLAVGARLGIGNDPTYVKSAAFDAFPFPHAPLEQRDQMAALAERLDQHRKDALARDELVTMTGMYNVVEKLRSGEALTAKERKIHEIAACGVLKDLHDELDALVAEAYGWPWPMEREEILERLVALHDERVEEEKRGVIRWLRPDYQIPRFAPDHAVPPAELDLGDEDEAEPDSAEAERLPWPATAVEQLEAITSLAGRGLVTVDGLVEAFDGAEPKLVARHLETLVMLGEVGDDSRL